jgi:enoyl-[acyl-carrier protein] reductase II
MKRKLKNTDLKNGELEIGQVSALINQVLSVEQIISNLISEYRSAQENLKAGGKYNF